MTDEQLQIVIASLATKEDIREGASWKGERTRQHMTMRMERQARKIQGLMDAMELLKYIDSKAG
jgi:hypothetical protein